MDEGKIVTACDWLTLCRIGGVPTEVGWSPYARCAVAALFGRSHRCNGYTTPTVVKPLWDCFPFSPAEANVLSGRCRCCGRRFKEFGVLAER